jgi:hypothetical protein
MVEAAPPSTLVVARSKVLLEVLIVSFDTPAHLGCLD